MIAIQSLWTKPFAENKCGWLCLEDMLASMELSVLLLKNNQQFEKVVFYTDNQGFEMTKPVHHYFDEIIVNLDEINWVENYNWAFQKLFIYQLQKEAFVHIDFDVYLWDGLPNSFLDKEQYDYFFQQREMIRDYPFYIDGYNEIKGCITKDILSYFPDYAINCGVAGFHDLSIIQQYYNNAKIMVERNQNHTWVTSWQKHHQCVLFEQLFLVPLIHGKNIGYLLNEHSQPIQQVRYCHLLASSKRMPENITRMHEKRVSYKRYYDLNNQNLN